MSLKKESIRIIIADDDRLTRSVLRLLLQENHYTVVAEAADGDKAIEACAGIQADIAFLDIDMPKLDGHAAARAIRRANPKIKIIMISALATLTNVQLAMQAGANAFVVKPFNALKVIEAVEKCVKSER